MSDLDKKLEEVLMPYDLSRDGLPAMGDLRTSSEKLIAEIKQAFIDVGWQQWQGPDSVHSVGLDIPSPEVEYDAPGHRYGDPVITVKDFNDVLMTGQEWYDRFEKEMRKYGNLVGPEANIPFDAAKKAAGIK